MAKSPFDKTELGDVSIEYPPIPDHPLPSQMPQNQHGPQQPGQIEPRPSGKTRRLTPPRPPRY